MKAKRPGCNLRNVDREKTRAHFDARDVRAGHELARPAIAAPDVERRESHPEDPRRRIVRLDARRRQRRPGADDDVRGRVERPRRAHAPSSIASANAPMRSSTLHEARTTHLPVRKALADWRKASDARRCSTRSRGASRSTTRSAFAASGSPADSFLDAWAHGHVPVESFFTPYHAVFYSGMLALLVFGRGFATALAPRSVTRGATRVPRCYRLALLGIPIFIAAGIGDMLWHRLFGIEEGVDALLSPTHQILGLGIFLRRKRPDPVGSRRARARNDAAHVSPRSRFGLATWLILAHFGTAYAFDPGRRANERPAADRAFHASLSHRAGDRLLQDRHRRAHRASFKARSISGFALWLVSRIRPALRHVDRAVSSSETSRRRRHLPITTPLLAVTLVQSLIAGPLADLFVARYDPTSRSADNARIFRSFAVAASDDIYRHFTCSPRWRSTACGGIGTSRSARGFGRASAASR